MNSSKQRPLVRNALPLEGIVFVIILGFVSVCAILRNVNLLVVVSGMMFAPLLLCWRLSRYLIRDMQVKRVVPNRVHVGQPVSIQWAATNNSSYSAFNLKVTDCIRRVYSGQQRASRFRLRKRSQSTIGITVFEFIPPLETVYSSYRVMFSERGVYEAGPAFASIQHPLPLIKCWYRSEPTSTIFVAPRLGVLQQNWEKAIAAISVGDNAASHFLGAEEDEFFAIRKWQSGDNLKRIHWRSTARNRAPMVKQFDRTVEKDMAVVLDLYTGHQNSIDSFELKSQSELCEVVLSFAATVIARWNENITGTMILAVAGDRTTIYSSGQAEFTRRAMQGLAIAEASANVDTESAIKSVLDKGTANSSCLIFSSRPMPPEIERDASLRSRVNWIYCGSDGFRRVFGLSPEVSTQKIMERD